MSANLTSSGLASSRGSTGMPRGEEVASFVTYAEAQRAVDALSDEGFPVQYLAIIGTDLRQVERITGRMSWGRAVLSGVGSGLWIGIFFGVMMMLFNPSGSGVPLAACILMGVGWGIVFQLISYALTRGRRDFTSISQVIASRYSIIAAQQSHEAARALAQVPGNLTRGGQAAQRAEERRRARQADGPTAFGSRPDEQPRYGVRLPSGQAYPQPSAGGRAGQDQPDRGRTQGPAGQVPPAGGGAHGPDGVDAVNGAGAGGRGREDHEGTSRQQGAQDDDVLAAFLRPRPSQDASQDVRTQDVGAQGGGTQDGESPGSEDSRDAGSQGEG